VTNDTGSENSVRQSENSRETREPQALRVQHWRDIVSRLDQQPALCCSKDHHGRCVRSQWYVKKITVILAAAYFPLQTSPTRSMLGRSLALCGPSARKSLVMAYLNCETMIPHSYGSECSLAVLYEFYVDACDHSQERWIFASPHHYSICSENSSHSGSIANLNRHCGLTISISTSQYIQTFD
jgi:hypothetical protein